VFAFFASTTTPAELRLALEKLGAPCRYAFGLSIAFQSVGLLSGQWQNIHEAQQARGALPGSSGLRGLVTHLGDWIALTVPAIVLATHRAWAITESAYARGFDSPKRRPYRQVRMRWQDWAWVVGSGTIVALLIFW
jgi:energy-coupling factor transporter transmembrane protein EcfT